MLINEKRYRLKSPEALAHELTVAHYLLHANDLATIQINDLKQSLIDTELYLYIKKRQREELIEKENKKVREYVS